MTPAGDPYLISLLKGAPMALVRRPRRWLGSDWVSGCIVWLIMAAFGALLAVWLGVGP